jgi:hypothetical protein
MLISKYSFFLLVSCISMFLLLGCVTIKSEQNEPNKTEKLPQYWLTISLYSGPFFDDDKLALLDYRPFSAIDDAVTNDGHIFYPPKSSKIIPAGTLIKIVNISYPDDKTMQKRPIYSPRNNIWVYVKVAKERGRVSLFHEQTHVMVIPKTITDESQLKGYLSRFLSNKDPNRWILQLESHIQDGIFNKRPIIGMKKEQVIAALGPALKKQFQKEQDFEPAQDIWHYHDYLIVFIDGAVRKIKNIKL